jgi:hypothetical protein
MARIAWNTAGSRVYEAGVDRGVLYIDALPGIPWIGLIAVDEKPTGAEAKPYYLDGVKYLNLAKTEEFEAGITAFTYPVEFSQCDGTARIRTGLFFGQQGRKSFGFSYRTLVGNDLEGTRHGYKIHLVYSALAMPATRAAASFNDNVEATNFNWELTTKPKAVLGAAPTAHVIVDSRYTHPVTLASIEAILYGDDENVARMPTPQELIEIFDIPVEWSVTDNEDGTFRVAGPDENVASIGLGMFTINHPDVAIDDEDTFTITYTE